MKRLRKWLTPLRVSVAAGVVGAIFLPQRVFAGVEGSILTFAGIVIAAAIPAMALMATVLRAGRRSVKEVRKVGAALLDQYDFWVGLLAVALLISVSLLLGSVLKWETATFEMPLPYGLDFDFDPVTVLNGCATAGLALLCFKGKPFVEGFRSLLVLHVEQVEEEAREAFEASTSETSEALRTRKSDKAFGQLVDPGA